MLEQNLSLKISNLKMVILRLQKNIDRFSFIVDIENKQVAIENETKNLIFDNHVRHVGLGPKLKLKLVTN